MLNSESKSWNVMSSSFGGSYKIFGNSLTEAIRGNFRKIVEDALGVAGKGRKMSSATAEFQQSILRGRGGVELTIEHVNKKAKNSKEARGVERTVVWIEAAPGDMPEKYAFKVAA